MFFAALFNRRAFLFFVGFTIESISLPVKSNLFFLGKYKIFN